MAEIADLKRKVRVCERISIVFLILAIVGLGIQYVLAEFYVDTQWAKQLMKFLLYSSYMMPVFVVLPWFFRVNYKNKLTLAMRKSQTPRSKL